MCVVCRRAGKFRDNPQRAAEMGARARSLFEQRFTLELAVEAWAHLIETLARKPDRAIDSRA